MWYPQNKKELKKELDQFLNQENKKINEIHGLLVPHAGYSFSGSIAGKAFSLLKNRKINKAIIIGLSHNMPLKGVLTSYKKQWSTPLGKINLFNVNFEEGDIEDEHSINNQIPFLQELNIKEVMPLIVGEITNKEAGQIAKKISEINAVYIFSTDLSHFLSYKQALKKDKETIKIIENLSLDDFSKIDACGFFPLLVMINLCKLKNWKPHLIKYENSGDIIADKLSVVGYASFYF